MMGISNTAIRSRLKGSPIRRVAQAPPVHHVAQGGPVRAKQPISSFGVAVQPGHVIANAHSGSASVVPWIPQVPPYRKREQPQDRTVTGNGMTAPPDMRVAANFLSDNIRITGPQSVGAVGGFGGGNFGGSGPGKGGTGGGGNHGGFNPN